MKIRVTLEFTLPEEALKQAEEAGVDRSAMPQAGADNIKALLGQFGLVADTSVGVEVL